MLKLFINSSILNTQRYQTYWKSLFWLILLVLLYLTLTPTPPKPVAIHNIDKLYHFCAFAGFTFVYTIAFQKLNSYVILVSSVLLGIFIEIIQFYIPNRGFSFADMLADGTGVLIGFCLAKTISFKLRNTTI